MKAWQKNTTYGSLAVLILVYLLNMASMIRINYDGRRYLGILEYLKGNNAFISAKNDFYPHGYPKLLQGLDKIGILSTESILLINLVSLMGGTYYFCKILKIKETALVLVFSLLSWINLNHFTLVLPDLLFMMTSAIALYHFQRFYENQATKDILIFMAATGVSVYLRTAGVFIPLGIFLFLWFRNIRRINPFLQGGFILASLGVVIFNWTLLKSKVDYLRQLDLGALFTGGDMNLVGRFHTHLIELGEIAVNVGINKLSVVLPPWLADAILVLGGIIAMVVIVQYIIAEKIYEKFIFWPVLTYSAIVFMWPFYDARFFIPVIPFIFIALVHALTHKNWKLLKMAVIPFVVLGIISLFYTTRISLDKDFFIKNYGNSPELRESYTRYRNAVNPSSTDTTLYLIKEYD